jgi:hypothetical protein
MREIRSSGSVEGAMGNHGSYSDCSRFKGCQNHYIASSHLMNPGFTSTIALTISSTRPA